VLETVGSETGSEHEGFTPTPARCVSTFDCKVLGAPNYSLRRSEALADHHVDAIRSRHHDGIVAADAAASGKETDEPPSVKQSGWIWTERRPPASLTSVQNVHGVVFLVVE